jgi:hypothetical protein
VGVKGMLPLGCFPLWGREGVILQIAAENKRIEKKEDFNRAIFFKFSSFFFDPSGFVNDLFETFSQGTDTRMSSWQMVKKINTPAMKMPMARH